MNLLNTIKKDFGQVQDDLTIEEYLKLCKKDNKTYLSPAERMLLAIGEPEVVDTKLDERLSRIYSNKIITFLLFLWRALYIYIYFDYDTD